MPCRRHLPYCPPSCRSGTQHRQKRSLCPSPKHRDVMKLIAPPPENGRSVSPSEDLLQWVELIQIMERKPFDLGLVSDFVRRNQEKRLPFPGDRKWYVRLCDLDGTIYMGQTHVLQAWQKLYLPQPIRMQVLGVLESSGSAPPFPQWVMLVGEDGGLYAYGDEELTLVTDSLIKLRQPVLEFTGPTYTLLDLSDEDEEELQGDPEIQRIRQSADDFIEESADDCKAFFEFYDS